MICAACNHALALPGKTVCLTCEARDGALSRWADERIAARKVSEPEAPPPKAAPQAEPPAPRPRKPRRPKSEPIGRDDIDGLAGRIMRWLKASGWRRPYGALRQAMHAWRYPAFGDALGLLAGRGDVRVERMGRRGRQVVLLRYPGDGPSGWLERQERANEEAARNRRRARQRGYRKGRHSAWFRERILGLPPGGA